jgi:hypothetical protein
MRQRLNLRKYPRGLPHRLQRVYARAENFGLRPAFAISDFFAISSLCTSFFVLGALFFRALHETPSTKYKVPVFSS